VMEVGLQREGELFDGEVKEIGDVGIGVLDVDGEVFFATHGDRGEIGSISLQEKAMKGDALERLA